MADTREPSMEEILASIRRIITEDGDVPAPAGTLTVPEPEPAPDEPIAAPAADVLELTQPLPEPVSGPELISQATAAVTSQSLAALSALAVRGYEGSENTLEGLVREMLKPLLRDWLDANLPTLVERIVTREVERITRR
jgi:cell pole-organizing protein PopZ